jgi:hypothetical protein
MHPVTVLDSDSGIKIAHHGCDNVSVLTPVSEHMLTDRAERDCCPRTPNSELAT